MNLFVRSILNKILISYKDETKRFELAQILYALSISFGWFIEDGYRRGLLLFAFLLLIKSQYRNNICYSGGLFFKIQKILLIGVSIWFTLIPLFFGASMIHERIDDILRPLEVILYGIIGWRLAQEQLFLRVFCKYSSISVIFFSVATFCYRFNVSFSTQREHWFFDMRAELAGIILLSLMPWLYYSMFAKQTIFSKKTFYFVVLLLSIVSVVVTYYRTIWVAFVGQIIMAFILVPKIFKIKWRNYLKYVLILLIMCVGGLYYSYQNNYEIRNNINSFVECRNEFDLDKFSSKRIGIWLEAISLVMKRPFFGYGWCEYNDVATIKKFHQHSSYLQAAFIGGIPGVLLYCGVLVALLCQGAWNIFYKQQNIELSFVVVLMLTATIIAGLCESYIYISREYLIPFWSVMSIFVSSSRCKYIERDFSGSNR